MNQSIKTPIALFTFNRPIHTRKVLESLSLCRRLDECLVFIYCDGPKSPEQVKAVNESREVVQIFADNFSANIVPHKENLGLARSIVSGVTDLCQKYGRVIVIEDDFILSSSFIDYMLQALDRYQDDTQVYQISGFMFPINFTEKMDTFFLPFTTTWGWATWQRAWDVFDWNAKGYQELLENTQKRTQFNLDNSYPYYDMLQQKFAGKNDSWGILWWYSVFKKEGLVLHPKKSLVWVGGFDGSGTHCGKDNSFQSNIQDLWHFTDREKINLPNAILCNHDVYSVVKGYIKLHSKKTSSNIIWRLIKKFSNKFKKNTYSQ